MSSKFSLQKPYVISSLPRPIDQVNGRYVAAEIYGGAPGSKKRKRSELAVGVDGEGVNLYDISSSRLITSYALPPQTFFTCPPASLRTRTPQNVERRTYVSTKGPQSQISLFKESTNSNGTIESNTKTQQLPDGNNAVYVGFVTAGQKATATEVASNLLLVKENGDIQCLDGESLREQWLSPASMLWRDTEAVPDAKVEFVHLTSAHAAAQGILKGWDGISTLPSVGKSADSSDLDVLVIITKSTSAATRALYVVALFETSSTGRVGTKASFELLLNVNLPGPTTRKFDNDASFSLQASTGVLQQLSGNTFTTFDLTETVPKEVSQFKAKTMQSFLKLSSTSVMLAADDSVFVFNSKYNSFLASIQLDGAPALDATMKRKKRSYEETNGTSSHTCQLISYFPKLGTVVGIADNDLIALQMDGKSPTTGLLIDAIGCSVQGPRGEHKQLSSADHGLSTLGSYLPGSFGALEEGTEERTVATNIAFDTGNIALFDGLMSENLGNQWGDLDEVPLTYGMYKKRTDKKPKSSRTRLDPADADRRWIRYALTKIFSWSREEDGSYRLNIPFYPPNLFMWLLKSGNMTLANIESALRDQIRLSALSSIPGGELVNALVELDPEMVLLLALISHNFLSPVELLFAIRILMDSLELFGTNASTKQRMILDGDEPDLTSEEIEEQVKTLQAEAEADLALAEYQLGPGSGVRGEALSIALSKLHACPSKGIVQALQTTFTSQEIVSLIYLLRFELARGAWTSRYIDADLLDTEEDGETADNSIMLISNLLNNCIDAIGAGGWLSGDASLVRGDSYEAEELIANLKLEVSAALEGIEEAVYLRGLMSEMVRYGVAFEEGSRQNSGPGAKKRKLAANVPLILPAMGENLQFLPMGLKADQLISTMRVGAGGELVERSMRDIGRLKSHKVGKYTLERIVI